MPSIVGVGKRKPYEAYRGVVMGRHGAVATAHPLATMAGIEVLRKGGNAVDAAIAAAAVLIVVEPHCSHLGGDAFMLIYSSHDKKVTAINASGPAPRAATLDKFADGVPLRGLRAASVPGVVHGWETALKRFGTMSLKELLQPAIRYAEEGFPVNFRLSEVLRASEPLLREFPSTAKAFLPNHRPPQPGELFVQPDLARTLKLIADGGSDAFYRGEIARAIHAFMRSHRGLMTFEDLAEYSCDVLEPIQSTYRGFTVCEQPPVSQGFIVLEELNILEGFDLAALGQGSAEVIHLQVEAKKLAFNDKNRFLADPAFVRVPIKLLTSKNFAAQRRHLIDLKKAAERYEPGQVALQGDTTYLCAADEAGNCISLIQSIFHSFGCGVVIEGTGILLNNRMNGFVLDPHHPNCLHPGKRPVHTLNCYMVFDGDRPVLVGGTPGGDAQVQTNLQILCNLLDFEMNVQEAIEAPRWTSGEGLDLVVEAGISQEALQKLERLGHRVRVTGPLSGSGRVQLIAFHPESKAMLAGSDPRCDGCALAF